MGRVLHPSHDVLVVRDGQGESRLGRCVVASGPLATMRGLLLTERPSGYEGALLRRCRSVHTFGMSFPIDIFFLEAHPDPEDDHRLGHGSSHLEEVWRFRVLSAIRGVPPWRPPLGHRSATDVLELAAPGAEQSVGRAGVVVEGDLLVVRRSALREQGR